MLTMLPLDWGVDQPFLVGIAGFILSRDTTVEKAFEAQIAPPVSTLALVSPLTICPHLLKRLLGTPVTTMALGQLLQQGIKLVWTKPLPSALMCNSPKGLPP